MGGGRGLVEKSENRHMGGLKLLKDRHMVFERFLTIFILDLSLEKRAKIIDKQSNIAYHS